MIICFKCSQETKQALDGLVQTGQYTDYAEAIASAIANLIILQTELSDKAVLVLGERDVGGSTASLQEPPSANGKEQKGRETTRVRSEVSGTPARQSGEQLRKAAPKAEARMQESTPDELKSTQFTVPTLFGLIGLEDIKLRTAPLPDDVWVRGQEIPLHRWLFGQYNRLLPAKANCRALAHLIKQRPSGVPLSEAASQIAQEVLILGEMLRYSDERHSVGRDDALATAFPTAKEDSDGGEKGITRYANHFVANVNTNGQLSGLLISLKLINYVKKKDPLLQLTEAGWQFAKLPNPVLEGQQERATQKFSEAETAFLLRHIADNVPAEDFVYRVLLNAIQQGANSPDSIDAELYRFVPPNHNLTDSFISSQRSGAISRMADLGLVERVRDGVKVTYTVTPGGSNYLRNTPLVVPETL
ncbi:MAG: hypothetical protein M3437_01740 [Chloroflexota bacterium]|nr:hypothetical protein [Chloroflexota bacterium]MDQ5865167.1 hypothetical protein [Chloroflexota bacterium]